eukprot:1333206-Amorphochlora_amoeboformis.AAC.2
MQIDAENPHTPYSSCLKPLLWIALALLLALSDDFGHMEGGSRVGGRLKSDDFGHMEGGSRVGGRLKTRTVGRLGGDNSLNEGKQVRLVRPKEEAQVSSGTLKAVK